MNRKVRALALILVVASLLALMPVAAFAEGEVAKNAEDSSDVTRVDRVNAMGYDFPEEGDTEIPKYKVVYPDGTEEIRYVATEMYDDSRSAPSGSTIVLLSDLYQSNTYIKALQNPEDSDSMDVDTLADLINDKIGIEIAGARTINFDFAGHTIFSEYKQTFFSCGGASTLNIYSSKPGARLIALEENKTSGGAVMTASSGGTINMGDYEDYPGENISTYSAGGFVAGSDVVINVTGITAYRVATDYVSYFGISGHDHTVNFTRVRAFGVGRFLQIATREDKNGGGPGATYGNTWTFQDCVISNIGSPGVVTGSFFRYMADDNKVSFKNTVFDSVGFTCDIYYEHESVFADKEGTIPKLPNETAVIEFDKYCSYNQLPDVKSLADKAEQSSKYAMFKFPELAEGYGERGSNVPDYILSDGLITNVHAIVMNDAYAAENGINDFRMYDLLEDYDDDLSGMFTLPYKGYENDVIEVTWEYQGATSETEYWIKGENPTPYTIDVPRDTRHIQYNTNKIYEDETVALYTVTPQVNITLKSNFTFDSSKMYMNIYIPVFEDLAIDEFVYKMSVAGTATKIKTIKEECELVELDGQQYYKVVTPIEYSRVTDKIILTIDVANRSRTGKSFTITKRISFTEIMKGYLDGEGDASFKKNVGEVVYYINKVSTAPAAIQELGALVNERFADRLKADAEKAEADKNSSSGSFIDNILNIFK